MFVSLGFIILGLYLMYEDDLFDLVHKLTSKTRFKGAKKEYSTLTRYLDKVFYVIHGKKDIKRVYRLYTITFFIFVFSFSVLLRRYSYLTAFTLSSLITSIPYLLLILRLVDARVVNSINSDMLLSTILTNYKKADGKMIKALEYSMMQVESNRIKDIIFELVVQLKTSKEENYMKQALKDFEFAFDTDWAKMLSDNINAAVIEESDITYSITFLKEKLNSARKIYEKGKENILDVVRVSNYAVPVLYIGSIYISVSMLSLSIKEVMYRRLYTATGMKLTLSIMLMWAVSLILIKMFNRRKLDI